MLANRLIGLARVFDYAAEVLADSPLVYWRLDETSGTTATDSSGNGNHGTYVNGPTLNQPPLIQDGRAVSFDGSNDYVVGPYLPLLGDAVIEVWYTPASLSSLKWIVAHGIGGESSGSNILYSLRTNGASLQVSWESGSGVNTDISTGISLVVGNKYHIVVERDSAAKTIRTTVNNVEISNITYANNPTGGTSGLFYVGGVGTTEPASGVIDEVAVYDHLLGSSRVSAHYNAGT